MQMPFCAIMRSWTLLAAFGGSYAPGFTVELLHLLLKEIENACTVDEFLFTEEYRVDMACTTCGYAIRVYEQIGETFKKNNDPVEYMKREMRKYFLKLFQDLYSQKSEEKTNDCLLCSRLEQSVKKEVIAVLKALKLHFKKS